MGNKDKIIKRQPKVNKKATFKEYSRLSYEGKKLFLKAHNIELGECKGIYDKRAKVVTFEQYKNPFTGKSIKVKTVFSGDMKHLPNEFPVKAYLTVIHLPKSQESIFDVLRVTMTRKAMELPGDNKSDLPIQSKTEYKRERSQKVKENAKSTVPKPIKKKTNLNSETLNMYKGMTVKYFFDYLPKNKYEQDVNSERLIGVKYGIYRDVMWAVDLLSSEIEEGSNICIVPSSSVGNTSKMTPVIKALESKKKINFLPALYRIKEKDKYHAGGKRTPSNEYLSLVVKDSERIKGKHIILIDDICTTGCSLFASSMLLKKNGASHVECIVLGRTK